LDRLFEDDEEEASYNWPTAPGEVFSVCVQSYRGDEGCRAEITYSYSANGEYYSGVFQRLLGSEDDAKGYLAPSRLATNSSCTTAPISLKFQLCSNKI